MLRTKRRLKSRHYQYNKLHDIDKSIKNLSVNQIIIIISIGFLLLFGFLALYLPQQAVQRPFIQMSNDNNTNINAKNNIDKEGHIQIFYYPWYGNPEYDDEYIHWNHDILPHWQSDINAKYEIGKRYDPNKDEIGASFYPELGAYSSSDPVIINKHFAMLSNANISVIVVSWHSPIAIKNNPDKSFADKDKITANNLDLLFKYAPIHGIKIAIHLEPYDQRTAKSTYQDLKYLDDKYGNNSAYFRSPKHDNKPFYYIYDSYKMKNNEWKKLLIKGIDDKLCVRDTKLDGIFLGLYLNKDPSETHIVESGFDGFYTYFAADGFTDGSSPNHWKRISKWSLQNKLIFIPSIGPGYNDLRVRPWNMQNTKKRDNGKYYKRYWNQIFDINSNNNDDEDEEKNDEAPIKYVSITSFNEWHEGTQIEPSIPKTSKNGYKYLDFEDEGGANSYMLMTKQFANKLLKQV